MKRTISLLSALAFVLAFSGSAFAQNPSITASADIVQDISVDNTTNLSFGQISNSQTADAVLDPTGNSSSGVGNTTTTGKIAFTAAGNSTVIISFTNPDNLTDASSNTIGFTPDYTGNKDSDSPGSSSDLNEETDNTITLNSGGQYYIYLGGTLTGGDIDGATTGTYDNSISATISYQ